MEMLPNHYRMFEIIDEVFATRSDPDQLQVDEKIIAKLQQIHPATIGELADHNGPLIWCLLIPTTNKVKEDFVAGKISENDLFNQTHPGEVFDCIYLCSVTTLPEQRGQGKTMQLCLEGIKRIQEDHPVKSLFVWAFSEGGDKLAESLSKKTGLPLEKRKHA